MRAAVCVGIVVLLAGRPAAGQEVRPNIVGRLEGHRGGVTTVVFNPALPLVATGAGNGVVRIWEERGGKLVYRIDPQRQFGARVNHIGFSADGWYVSTSSKNAVIVWDLAPPAKKDAPDETDPDKPRPPRLIPTVFEDGQGNDPAKIGTVTGNRKRCFYAVTEGARVAVNSASFANPGDGGTNDELRGSFTPLALTALADPDGELVAMYGLLKSTDRGESAGYGATKTGDKLEPAVAFVGLGDPRVIGRGSVRGPIPGRPVAIAFAPDGKWLVACNGEDLMYWRVPGSQVVDGDPRFLTGVSAYAAAPGPNGLVAFASPPAEGKKVRVTLADLNTTPPQVRTVFATDIDRVSALAFNPDGTLLAVADDADGVVQLWALEKPSDKK